MKKIYFLVMLAFFMTNSWAQTNPSVHDLTPTDYTFTGFALGTTTTYPTSMQGHKFPAERTTANLTANADGDFALSNSSSAIATGSIRNEVANGISLLNSASNNIGAILVAVNTTGREDVRVTFTVAQLNSGGNGATDRINGLRLQYRIGTSGIFTDVAGTEYLTTNTTSQNPPQTFTSVALPAACDNEPIVHVRWVYYISSGTAGSRDRIRLDDITITSSASGGGTPDIALSSSNPAVPAGNIVPGTGINPIYLFDLTVSTASANLTGITVTTDGTYSPADLANLRAFYSTDAILDGGDILLSTIVGPAAAGTQVFPAFNQAIGIGTGYIFITAELTCGAAIGNTISVNAITTADLTFPSGNKSGTAFAGDAQTVIGASPNNVTGAGATNGNTESSVSWTNPIACYDEVMIVAATAANTGTPTGDGTAYTGDLLYGNGTLLGNGFIVYKGNASPQIVTGLTNGTTYFFKIFARFGTNWNSGVEVTATPSTPSSATDYFRSIAPSGGNWSTPTSWESSPDNVTWATSTLVPNASANTITIRNGHTITVGAAAGGDQVVVEPGATLTLNASFTLADGTGTDMTVDGTVINSAGTHVFTGSSVFNASSLYQHNRNGGAVPTAAWDVTSTLEVTGGTTSPPTNISQTLGNFTWNSNTTTTTNLVGTLTTVAGNFRVQNSGTAALRLTGAADLTLIINGNFIVEDDLDIDNNATGVANIAIGGNFSHTGGSFGSSTDVATISMTGAGKSISLSGGTYSGTNINWVIDGAASSSLSTNLPLSTGRSLLINGVLDASINQLTGAGAVTINGILKSANTNGIGLTGTLANTGAITPGAAWTVEYNAAGPQVFNNRADYVNVIISGGGDKILDGPAIMSGNLSLLNGQVISTAFNILELLSTATVTGGSASSYVDGPFRRNTNAATSYGFPVGKSGSYHPVTVTPVSAAASTYLAEYFNSAYSDLSICDPARLDAIVNNEYWDVAKLSGADAQVSLEYNAANTWSNSTAPDMTKVIVIAHFVSACWQDESGTFVLGTSGPATLTTKILSTFSPFTIAYGPLAVLPVNFGTVRATQQTAGIKVEWTNMTETDILNYSVERSADGNNFLNVGTVTATRNNGGRADYSFFDLTAPDGVNFYRINAKGTNGSAKYSIIVKVNTKGGGTEITIYPNPVSGNQVSLQATALPKGQYTIRIVNATGQQVYTKQWSHSGGSVTETVPLPSTVRRGMYSIQLIGGDISLAKPFIIR